MIFWRLPFEIPIRNSLRGTIAQIHTRVMFVAVFYRHLLRPGRRVPGDNGPWRRWFGGFMQAENLTAVEFEVCEGFGPFSGVRPAMGLELLPSQISEIGIFPICETRRRR